MNPSALPSPLVARPRFTPAANLGWLAASFALVAAPWLSAADAPLGVFTSQSDIGATGRPGTAAFDPAKGIYTLGGGGADMWAAADAFHFVWSKLEGGDGSLAADISFPSPGGAPHRKACLVIRQGLDPDSAYADVALHGDGSTSLQFRDSKGDTTHEIQLGDNAPKRLRIEKRGPYVSLSVAGSDGVLHPVGGVLRLEFTGPFYLGLGVCAHDNTALESARFANLELVTGDAVAASKPAKQLCTIETIEVATLNRKVIYTTDEHIEAPNWTRDGKTLLYNSTSGATRLIHRIPVAGGTPEIVNTGMENRVNNDHGLSPDGTMLAISDQSQGDRTSRIYLLPLGGGTPRQITPAGPSYWHGWSPDGTTLVFCGSRPDAAQAGKANFDVYSIPAAGGPETRLTNDPGLDDGPEYSPDGKYIYFNSERTGKMQIWRMHPDGTAQEPVTTDDYNNWFAHPSPDGKWLAFISFEPSVSSGDHSGDKAVTLRLMPAVGGKITVAAKLFGGQGTMNVPSWSPDSSSFAFVSYTPVPPPVTK